MKVAIIIYSVYGHVLTMAKSIKEGVEKSGVASHVEIFQVPETLRREDLDKIHAPEKTDLPIATMETLIDYDAFLFGYPTRFGNLPAQLVEYLGRSSGLWSKGALHGKPAGMFTSVSSSGGGAEMTLRSFLSYIVHHGMVYVPLGCFPVFADLSDMEEVHGGSPYGTSTFAGSTGTRQPSDMEKTIAFKQGKSFARIAVKFSKGYEAPKTLSTEKPNEETPSRTRARQSRRARIEKYFDCGKCDIM